MHVKQSGTLFSFYFHTLSDIGEFNDWLDEVGLSHARVILPHNVSNGRTLRRLMTRHPSIIAAPDADAMKVIKARWMIA